VALAPPPPEAPAKPLPLRAAPNAMHGVTLANLAEHVPAGTRTDPSRVFTCGAGYKLYPEVSKQPDGKDALVYWKAFNTETKRVEFLVGPDALKTFTSAPSDYATAAANAFMGEQDAATRESARVVDLAVRKGFGPAIGHLGTASEAAWSDPKWVAKTVMGVASSLAVPEASTTSAAEVESAASRTLSEAGATGPTAGGSIRGVNKDLPIGNTAGDRANNCANCAIATDAMLAGRPACALPGRVTPASKLSEYFGTRWSKEMKTEADMAAAMKSAGPGKRAVVFGLPAGTTTGHFFNVVNQDGAIRFLDGQSGTSANVAPYTKFWLLPTN
jgi:hypothetical protein